MGVKLGTEGLLLVRLHPHQCNGKFVGPPKLKFLLTFDQNVEYERPTGRIPCAIFTKFAEFKRHLTMRWVLKFGWICPRGYGVMGVLR